MDRESMASNATRISTVAIMEDGIHDKHSTLHFISFAGYNPRAEWLVKWSVPGTGIDCHCSICIRSVLFVICAFSFGSVLSPYFFMPVHYSIVCIGFDSSTMTGISTSKDGNKGDKRTKNQSCTLQVSIQN